MENVNKWLSEYEGSEPESGLLKRAISDLVSYVTSDLLDAYRENDVAKIIELTRLQSVALVVRSICESRNKY